MEGAESKGDAGNAKNGRHKDDPSWQGHVTPESGP